MNYHIFIDETGSFGKRSVTKNNTNFVAGWVCEGRFTSRLEDFLRDVALPCNRDITKTLGENYTLKIPDHLHFIPLHIPGERKNADSKIRIPVGMVQPVVSAIFDGLQTRMLFAFRSTGFPRYYSNEQGAYIDILRATLLQVLDNISIGEKDRIEITIASRRIKLLMGEYGFNNCSDYERSICHNLLDEITRVFNDRGISKKIRISMQSARHSAPLAVADLFCGAFRWRDYDYLEALSKAGKTKRYSIHNAFMYLSNRTVPRLQHIFSEDPVAGMLSCLEHLAGTPNNEELAKAADSMSKRLDKEEKRLFENQIKAFLDEKLINAPNRYENLNFILTFMEETEKRFKSIGIRTLTARSRIRISCHRGETDLKDVQNYLGLLETRGGEIFGSMYGAAQERLETVLIMVQAAAFNTFRFEEVENILSEEMKRYSLLFPVRNGIIDEARARLEGTLGQMYAFLCDYPDGEVYHKEAETYLKQSIAHCADNSPFWVQGMGYLTTLYFKRGKFEKAVENFLKETSSKTGREKDIFILSKTDDFQSGKGDFFLLHRLYLSVLGLKNGIEVIGEQMLGEKLLDKKAVYPRFLSMKWLGVIHAMKGDHESALALFEHALSGEQGDFTLEAIKIPIKLLAHCCKKQLGRRSKLDLKKELYSLEKQVPGTTHNLKYLGIQSDLSWDENRNWYTMANMMPFYYS